MAVFSKFITTGLVLLAAVASAAPAPTQEDVASLKAGLESRQNGNGCAFWLQRCEEIEDDDACEQIAEFCGARNGFFFGPGSRTTTIFVLQSPLTITATGSMMTSEITTTTTTTTTTTQSGSTSTVTGTPSTVSGTPSTTTVTATGAASTATVTMTTTSTAANPILTTTTTDQVTTTTTTTAAAAASA